VGNTLASTEDACHMRKQPGIRVRTYIGRRAGYPSQLGHGLIAGFSRVLGALFSVEYPQCSSTTPSINKLSYLPVFPLPISPPLQFARTHSFREILKVAGFAVRLDSPHIFPPAHEKLETIPLPPPLSTPHRDTLDYI